MRRETRVIFDAIKPAFLLPGQMAVQGAAVYDVSLRHSRFAVMLMVASLMFNVAALYALLWVSSVLRTPEVLEEWRWLRRERLTGYGRPPGVTHEHPATATSTYPPP